MAFVNYDEIFPWIFSQKNSCCFLWKESYNGKQKIIANSLRDMRKNSKRSSSL